MPYNPDNNPWSRSRFKGLRWADQWGKPTRDWGIYGTRFMHTPTAEEEEAMANNSSLQAALMLAVAQAPVTQTTSGPVNKDGKPKESNSKSMGQEAGAPESSSSPSMGQEAGAPDSVIEDTNSRQNAALNDSTQSQNGGPEEYTQSVLSELKANPELLNQAQQSIDRGGAQGLNEYFNQRYSRVGGLKFPERSHPSAQVVVSMAERMDIGLGVERVLSKIRSLAQLHANPRLYKMAAQSGAELFAASRSAMSMNPFEYGVLNRPRWEREVIQANFPCQDCPDRDKRDKIAATVMAESADGQEKDVVWIYYNLVEKPGSSLEKGLSASTAYRKKSRWYKLYWTLLGHDDYSEVLIEKIDQDRETIKSKTIRGGQTTIIHYRNYAEWAEREFHQTFTKSRLSKLLNIVEEVYTDPTKNPYPNFFNQGSLADINNESNSDVMWTQARQYYWLQKEGKVTEVWLYKFGEEDKTTVIFRYDKIKEYFRLHPDQLPQEVKKIP